MNDDLISRCSAIDALWKALYEYEDKIERQFQESEDLDIGDWIEHRIFVQNMNDIDRQTILNLPTAESEIVRCKDCRWGKKVCGNIECFVDSNIPPEYHGYEWFCPNGERRSNGSI